MNVYRFLFLVPYLLVINCKQRQVSESKIGCFSESAIKHHPQHIPIMDDLVNPSRRAIFFIQTRCVSSWAGYIVLDYIETCAIESAAKQNRGSDVYVLILSSTGVRLFQPEVSARLEKILLQYRNIYIRRIKFLEFIYGTPLQNWQNLTKLLNSPYTIYHTSDILRLVTLWKYGGTYLDLDTITMLSLTSLGKNYVGAETTLSVANGVLNFEQNHSVINMVYEEYQRMYDPDFWSMGPTSLTQVIRKRCGTIHDLLEREEHCQGIKVYSPNMFYAIPVEQWESLFSVDNSTMVLNKIRVANSKIVHIWRSNMGRLFAAGPKSPYGILSRLYCPISENSMFY